MKIGTSKTYSLFVNGYSSKKKVVLIIPSPCQWDQTHTAYKLRIIHIAVEIAQVAHPFDSIGWALAAWAEIKYTTSLNYIIEIAHTFIIRLPIKWQVVLFPT